MIKYCSGDLLSSEADAIVNPVNCKGVMGKGLALQFKKKYPINFRVYRDACASGYLRPGRMLTAKEDGKFIINFPTKDDWRQKSKLTYIEEGLVSLLDEIEKHNIKSIAIPPLGCGNGGLEWQTVRKLIEESFRNFDYGVEVTIFSPAGQDSLENDLTLNMDGNTRELVKRTLTRYLQKKFSYKNGQYRILYTMVLSNIIMNSDYFCIEFSGSKINYSHLNEYLELNRTLGLSDSIKLKMCEISGFQNEERIVAVSMNIIDGIQDPDQIKVVFAICHLFSEHWFRYQNRSIEKQRLNNSIALNHSYLKNVDSLIKDSIDLLIKNKYIIQDLSDYRLNVEGLYQNALDCFPRTFERCTDSDHGVKHNPNPNKSIKSKKSVEKMNSIPIHKININTCDVITLQQIPGLGEDMAKRIIAFRKHIGKYESLNDLLRIMGIGKGKLSHLSDFLTCD